MRALRGVQRQEAREIDIGVAAHKLEASLQQSSRVRPHAFLRQRRHSGSNLESEVVEIAFRTQFFLAQINQKAALSTTNVQVQGSMAAILQRTARPIGWQHGGLLKPGRQRIDVLAKAQAIVAPLFGDPIGQ